MRVSVASNHSSPAFRNPIRTRSNCSCAHCWTAERHWRDRGAPRVTIRSNITIFLSNLAGEPHRGYALSQHHGCAKLPSCARSKHCVWSRIVLAHRLRTTADHPSVSRRPRRSTPRAIEPTYRRDAALFKVTRGERRHAFEALLGGATEPSSVRSTEPPRGGRWPVGPANLARELDPPLGIPSP